MPLSVQAPRRGWVHTGGMPQRDSLRDLAPRHVLSVDLAGDLGSFIVPDSLTVEPFPTAGAIVAAVLRPATRDKGISLGLSGPRAPDRRSRCSPAAERGRTRPVT